MTGRTRLLGLLVFSGVWNCHAAVSIDHVTDAAAYGPRVAPGSLASVFGSNLASGELAASSFPLPTSLGGTSVLIGTTQVPLTYVNTSQINFQVPASLKSGQTTLTVHAPGGVSSAFTFLVTASAPSIFEYGVNRSVAIHADNSLNSSTHAAASGSTVTVYLTGQGAVDNAVADGAQTPISPLSKASATATATIGTLNAPISFLGLAPGFAGLAQANIEVPALPSGDYPLVITVGGFVSASALLAVSGSGTYTDPLVLIGTAAFSGSSNSTVALYNNVAYVCGPTRIVMVDVSTPTAPSFIGEFGDSELNGNGGFCAINAAVSTPFLVDIVGSPVNPTTNSSFASFSLSNPKSPTLLGQVTLNSSQTVKLIHIVSLSFADVYGFCTTSYTTYNGSNAVTAQNGDFLAFDFTIPGAPQLLGILQPGTTPGSGSLNLKPYSAVVGGGYAYVTSTTATGSNTNGTGILNIVNISSPLAPFAANQVGVTQASILLSFDISGTTLLVSGNSGGMKNPGNPNLDYTGNLTLSTFDVTTIANPNLISTFKSELQVNGTLHTAAFPGGVFGIVNNPPSADDAGPAALLIVDARKPSNILLYPVQTQFGFSGVVATTGGYLLASTLLGLNVYQLKLQ